MHISKPLKAKLDALRAEGTTASGLIRRLLNEFFGKVIQTRKEGNQVSSIEQRHRGRLALMARRCGCRISRPKPEDPVDRGAYRLLDLVNNRVLLGEEFEATLEEIEIYLKRERNTKKTPAELHDNIVRQLAAERGYLVRKSRPRLFSKHSGEYQLFRKSDPTTPVTVTPDRSPTLDELEAFLRAQPTGSHNGVHPCASKLSTHTRS